MKLGNWFIFILLALSCLQQPQILVVPLRMTLFCYFMYIVFNLFTRITIWTAKETILVSALGAVWVVNTGSKALKNVEFLKPVSTFSFDQDMPVIMMSAVEHRSEGQRGFTQRREQGGSDDDDANGSYETGNRNGSVHADESSWTRVLAKYTELDARLEQLEKKNGRQTGDTLEKTS